MSKISVSLENDILNIVKDRARRTPEDVEAISLSDLEYGKFYTSAVKITNESQSNKLLFFQPLEAGDAVVSSSFDEEESENPDDEPSVVDENSEMVQSVQEARAVIVVSEGNKIRYAFCSLEKAYKRLIKFRYKVLDVSLSKSKLKVSLVAYIINKYDIEIGETALYVDQDTKRECTLVQSPCKLSVPQMLLKGTVVNLSYDMKEIINDGSEVNGNFQMAVTLKDGTVLNYKIAKKDEKIKNKRYYYAPVESVFVGDYAVHIRRTPGGNLVLVKRLKEEYENTLKFKLLENRFVSWLLYFISRILLKTPKKKINLFYEKFASKAEEGAYDLFLLARNSTNSKNYFVIDPNTEDYERIKSEKNVVKKYSLKYYWLVYNVSNFISTEAPIHLNILRSNNTALRKSTCDKNFVFLQHGVTYLKCQGPRSTFAKNREGEVAYIVVGSEKEMDVVVDMLKIPESRVLNTGLPIFSKAKYGHINAESEDTATIMLTWKPYEEHLYSFEESSYYKNTIEIFNILQKYMPKEKITVIPHPKVLDLMQSTSMKDSIWNGKISEALEKTKLLITDYSSVCYNTFYQGGAVVFYQDDLEKYEMENGPLIPEDDEYIGKRCFSMDELESVISDTVRDGKIDLHKVRTEEFEKSYKTINEFSDGKNIERIYSKLGEMGLI